MGRRNSGVDPKIDFHSPEFNRIDDLQDCTGRYQSFQTLEGVVTADMRHQVDREAAGSAALLEEVALPSPRRGADHGDGGAGLAPEPVTVISRGRVLIVDRDPGRAVACGRRLAERGLSCTLVVTKDDSAASAAPADARPALRETHAVAISGVFGNFAATATPGMGPSTLTESISDGADHFDCVLDLQAKPSYSGPLLPLGYYAPGADPVRLEGALTELPEMKGRFQKPRFTALLENRCLHRRTRAGECRRCREICPFEAIHEDGRRILVDDALCQGCGGCALVCPAGAMRMIHPSAEEQLVQLRRLLVRPPAVTAPVTVTIRDALPARVAARLNPGAVPGGRPHDLGVTLAVEQIGHVRLETLLHALVYGADRVVVVCGPCSTPQIREAVRRQTLLAAAILRGCGLPEDTVRFVAGSADDPEPEAAAIPAEAKGGDRAVAQRPPAAGSPPDDTRSLVRMAAQQLYDRSGAHEPSLPLPAGSSFGAVGLSAAACTLCMACAAVCPAGALSACEDAPRLEFRESLCHQCGLCEQTCPEGALRLQPRLLCDPRAVDARAVLHEAEAARCLACGAPFAPRAMVDRMRDKLRGHWMYVDERQMRRLSLCGTCRARDAFTSEDLRRWSH